MGPVAPVTRVRRVLRSLNCDGAAGLALLAACAALPAIALLGPDVRDALRYERSALAAGEWWRLASAHVAHLDLAHAALNALGLVLVWALFARDYAVAAWAAIVVASAAAVDAGLWLFVPQVEWYVGLSGVLHGIMAAGTLAHVLRREPDRWVLAAFLLAKLGWEQGIGPLPFESTGAVIVQAHLWGALGGLAGALPFALAGRPRRSLPL